MVLPSREDQDRPVIDLDLHLPFLCFSHTTLLQVRYIIWPHKSEFRLGSKACPLLRSCPASFKSRGWCSSLLTGPDSRWSLRVCCSTCRSVSYTGSCYISFISLLYLKPVISRLLQPLSWQQPYVPVLARGMLDFLMAPTAFLMGCHISHFEEVAAVSTDIPHLELISCSVSFFLTMMTAAVSDDCRLWIIRIQITLNYGGIIIYNIYNYSI